MMDEEDASNVGAFVTTEEADELRRRVAACGADESAFLGFAAANSYEEIGASRLPELQRMLSKKEAKKKGTPSAAETEQDFKW